LEDIENHEKGDNMAQWVKPTGNVPHDWNQGYKAYDGSLIYLSGCAYSDYILPPDWSGYLELTFPATLISKVRTHAAYGYVNKKSVDVYYSGDWHNIYEDSFSGYDKVWQEHAIGSEQTCTAIRIKFQNNDPCDQHRAYLAEAEYWDITFPTITIQTTTLIEETTATGNGNITVAEGLEITKRGFCYNTTGNPTVVDDKVEEEGSYGTGAFALGLTSLSPGTKYYIKAYAYNANGYAYSGELEFTTKPNDPSVLACEVISSTQINLTWTKGTGAEKTMIRRKIGEAPASVTDGDEAYFGTGESFSDDNLVRCTHYYYRAWSFKTGAPNSGYSDGYSEDDDSTPAELATVITLDATDILQAQVTGNGEITDTGGVDVTTRGFYYALTKDLLDEVHDDGTYGIGVYEKDITTLDSNTEYWYCAYAVNSIGTAYGEWVKFQTATSGVIPTGTLMSICSDYSGYTYEMNKSLTDDGQTYTSFFTLSTDLAQKQELHIYKRLEDLYNYFIKRASGTAKIYVKCDSEAEWQYAGEISMTGDADIIVKHLPSENLDGSGDVDFLAKHFLIKFVFENDFEFIGLITGAVPIGVT